MESDTPCYIKLLLNSSVVEHQINIFEQKSIGQYQFITFEGTALDMEIQYHILPGKTCGHNKTANNHICHITLHNVDNAAAHTML